MIPDPRAVIFLLFVCRGAKKKIGFFYRGCCVTYLRLSERQGRGFTAQVEGLKQPHGPGQRLEGLLNPSPILPSPTVMMATVDGTNCYGAAVCFSFSLLISPQPRRLYHHHKPKRKGADSPVVRHFFVAPGNAVFSILCPFSCRRFSCVLVSRFCPFTYETVFFNGRSLVPPQPSPCSRVAAFLFLLCWLRGGGGRIQHQLGLNREQMGQFGVLLQALCPRVLLISTLFSHPPWGALPGSGASDITGGKQ